MAQYLTYNTLLSYYYRIKEWLLPSDFYLVDTEKNCVLALGTSQQVELAMDQRVGKFCILRGHELPEGCDTTAVEPF